MAISIPKKDYPAISAFLALPLELRNRVSEAIYNAEFSQSYKDVLEFLEVSEKDHITLFVKRMLWIQIDDLEECDSLARDVVKEFTQIVEIVPEWVLENVTMLLNPNGWIRKKGAFVSKALDGEIAFSDFFINKEIIPYQYGSECWPSKNPDFVLFAKMKARKYDSDDVLSFLLDKSDIDSMIKMLSDYKSESLKIQSQLSEWGVSLEIF